MQPSSEAYEIEDRCFRDSVARRLMLPRPAAANPADVVQFCPNKSAAGVICNKPSRSENSIIAMAADMEEALIADMQHWRDALRISFIRTAGSKYLLNKKYLPLPVLSMDRLNTLGWILSSISTVQSRIWMSLSLLPSLAIRPWVSAASTKPGLMAKRAEKTKFDRYPHINLVPFILETTGRPGPHARKFINYLLRDADNPPIAVRDTWSTIQSVLHSALPKPTHGSCCVTLGVYCHIQLF